MEDVYCFHRSKTCRECKGGGTVNAGWLFTGNADKLMVRFMMEPSTSGILLGIHKLKKVGLMLCASWKKVGWL